MANEKVLINLYTQKRMTQTQQNNIDWFQETTGAQYPEQVQLLLKAVVTAQQTTEILFKVPEIWWKYKVLDFQLLDAIRNDPDYTTEDYKEIYKNPYLLWREMLQRFKEDKQKELLPENVLPFAVDAEGDGFDCMCFLPGSNLIYRCNMDNNDLEMVPMGAFEQLLGPLDEIIKGIENGKKSFDLNKVHEIRPTLDTLIAEKNTHITDGECIYDVDDYKTIIEDLTAITDGELTLEAFNGSWEDETIVINATINGVSGTFSLEVNSDWVDSAIVDNLNALLEPLKKDRFFIEVYDENRWGQEFGVVYGDKAARELLIKNKLVPGK